jgi:hypothetical protein
MLNPNCSNTLNGANDLREGRLNALLAIHDSPPFGTAAVNVILCDVGATILALNCPIFPCAFKASA